MIILGIQSLNVNSDISLQTLVRELFEFYLPTLVKYLSNFESRNNSMEADPLTNCFLKAKPEFTHFILETLTNNFITTPTNNKTNKTCSWVKIF